VTGEEGTGMDLEERGQAKSKCNYDIILILAWAEKNHKKSQNS
jgi:hypothetical protein